MIPIINALLKAELFRDSFFKFKGNLNTDIHSYDAQNYYLNIQQSLNEG